MPATVRLVSIHKGAHSNDPVIVHVEVQSQGFEDIKLAIGVPNAPTADQILRDASNQLTKYVEDIQKALERTQGLRF